MAEKLKCKDFWGEKKNFPFRAHSFDLEIYPRGSLGSFAGLVFCPVLPHNVLSNRNKMFQSLHHFGDEVGPRSCFLLDKNTKFP